VSVDTITPPVPAPAGYVAPELQWEIEQFLYHEAALLDGWWYRDWFELLADDLEYWMPLRGNRLARDQHLEMSGPDDTALFDEDKDSIDRRILKIETGMSWAEDPPSRTRHAVSNVQVFPTDRADEYEVRCTYMLYRSRLERDVDLFVGARQDVLRRDPETGWKIARRKIVLDQATLLAKNLSIFF
jgi:3-phenylpropionate/cinnamic acid dioxygenase small subunit